MTFRLDSYSAAELTEKHHELVGRGPEVSENIIALLSGYLKERILDAGTWFTDHCQAARNRDRRLTGINVRPPRRARCWSLTLRNAHNTV